MDISAAMRGSGFNRSAEECRTKSKLLRRDFKRAVAHNSMSGRAPATFPYYDEMQSIFRGDAGIMPRRIADSHVAPRDDVIKDNTENETVTLDLYPVESSPIEDIENTPPLRHTHGLSDLSADESFLDPAARLSLIRQRKSRTTAVGQIKECISSESAVVVKKLDETIAVNRETKEMLESYLSMHQDSVNRMENMFMTCISNNKYLGLHCKSSSALSNNLAKATVVPQINESDPLSELDYLEDSPNVEDTTVEIGHDEGHSSDVDSDFSLSLPQSPVNQKNTTVNNATKIQSKIDVNQQLIMPASTTAEIAGNSTEVEKTISKVLEGTYAPVDLPTKATVAQKGNSPVSKRWSRSEIVAKVMSDSPIHAKPKLFPNVLRQKNCDLGNAAIKTDLSRRFEEKKGQKRDPYLIVKKEPQQRLQTARSQREIPAIKRSRKPPAVYSP